MNRSTENAASGTHEQTTPGALHRLLARLFDDHQRMYPHHAHLCPLCQDTELALTLLAELLPDGDDACPGCCAPAGAAHADCCPGKDGRCPGCASAPGDFHLAYCPVGRSRETFQPRSAGQPALAPIPHGISSYQLPDGTTGTSYTSSTLQPR